jgi:hypothetical protein
MKPLNKSLIAYSVIWAQVLSRQTFSKVAITSIITIVVIFELLED